MAGTCQPARCRRILWVLLACLALMLATACSPAAPAGLAPTALRSEQPLATSTASPTVGPSATPVVVLGPPGQPTQPDATQQAAGATLQAAMPTQAPDLLRFIFPTAASEPISLWRPPLYPVPWEPSPYDHFYFIRPIGADDVNWPLARYRYGGMLYSEPHTGIDIPARKGTPILAAGPGTVVWAGWGLYNMAEEYSDPYGIAVMIKHDFGYQGSNLYTVYGHMDQTLVYRGQRVEPGQQIGLVGETGKASGPHLHFEVRIGESNFFVSRNPELWISPPQGWGVLVGRIMDSSGQKYEGIRVKLFSREGKGNYEVLAYAEGGAVNSDPYYQENVVLGDLPAGEYTLAMDYDGVTQRSPLTIRPGQVTFFSFRGGRGYSFAPPPTPTAAPSSVPPFPSATPTPTPITPTPVTPSPTPLSITLTP